MNPTQYGSTLCSYCGRVHFAILLNNEKVIPPPSIIVSCQCGVSEVVKVELFYSGMPKFGIFASSPTEPTPASSEIAGSAAQAQTAPAPGPSSS